MKINKEKPPYLPKVAKEDDNRVMLALYEAEQYNPFAQYINDFEGFKANWEAGSYDPGCTYTFPLSMVEVLEVVQEEEDNTDYERAQKAAAAEKEARREKDG